MSTIQPLNRPVHRVEHTLWISIMQEFKFSKTLKCRSLSTWRPSSSPPTVGYLKERDTLKSVMHIPRLFSKYLGSIMKLNAHKILKHINLMLNNLGWNWTLVEIDWTIWNNGWEIFTIRWRRSERKLLWSLLVSLIYKIRRIIAWRMWQTFSSSFDRRVFNNSEVNSGSNCIHWEGKTWFPKAAMIIET